MLKLLGNITAFISNDKPFFQASESQVEQHKMASQTPETLLKLIQIKTVKV